MNVRVMDFEKDARFVHFAGCSAAGPDGPALVDRPRRAAAHVVAHAREVCVQHRKEEETKSRVNVFAPSCMTLLFKINPINGDFLQTCLLQRISSTYPPPKKLCVIVSEKKDAKVRLFGERY